MMTPYIWKIKVGTAGEPDNTIYTRILAKGRDGGFYSVILSGAEDINLPEQDSSAFGLRMTKRKVNHGGHGDHGEKVFVIPAKAGIHRAAFAIAELSTPACAGVTAQKNSVSSVRSVVQTSE